MQPRFPVGDRNERIAAEAGAGTAATAPVASRADAKKNRLIGSEPICQPWTNVSNADGRFAER